MLGRSLLESYKLYWANEDFRLVPSCAANKVEFFGLSMIAAIFKALECTKDKQMMGSRG